MNAGQGALRVERVRGRCVATRCVAASPLRWLLPDNRGHALWAYTTSYGGGMVDGDALSLDVDVGPDTSLLLATQASTKVFRGPLGSRQSLALKVGAGSLAVVAPDPVVCFADARYAQRTDVDLGPGASLVLLDTLHAGRVSRGERWQLARYASRLDVRREGKLVVTDRQLLDRDHGPIADRLRGFDALANLWLVGGHVASHAAALLQRLARVSPATHATRVESVTAVDGGALVRVAATTAAEALAVMRGHLGFMTNVLGDDPFTRRW